MRGVKIVLLILKNCLEVIYERSKWCILCFKSNIIGKYYVLERKRSKQLRKNAADTRRIRGSARDSIRISITLKILVSMKRPYKVSKREETSPCDYLL